MSFRYPVRYTGELLVYSDTAVKSVRSVTFVLYQAGTNTPATIYSNDAWAIANTTGSITTDPTGNYTVWLDPQYEYEVFYKGARYPRFSPGEDRREAEADLLEHEAKTGGVHGVPSGEEVAWKAWVSANFSGGGGGGGTYTLPTATTVTKGGILLGANVVAPGGVLDLSAALLASIASITGKYTKPFSGIPVTDLDSTTQANISAIGGKYVKPTGGITSTDLSATVNAALTKANTAVQPGTGPRIYAGSSTGPPTVGTFTVGDQANAGNGRIYVCTTGGTNTSAVWYTNPRISVGPTAPPNPLVNDLWIKT